MAEYFSHDYDAREDEKIQNLVFKLGMEGYGIYWAIVEMLYKNDGYMQTQCERIAFALHADKDKINSVINDFSLFQINGNAFTSTSVLHRLKLRKGKSFTAKKAAKARWDKVKANDADAMQAQCDSNAKKESKVKEIKEKESKVKYTWDDERFSQVWEFWKKYKKEQFRFTYKNIGENGALAKLYDISGGKIETAMMIIKQSIQNGWQGLFELKGENKNQEYNRQEIYDLLNQK